MKIISARTNGFCVGVRHAVELAENTAGGRVFMYGEIVHNERVVNRMKEKGFRVLNDLGELLDGDTLIISAHGAPKSVYEFAEEKNVTVVDATCVFVRNMQKKAEEKHNEGYNIVIFGEKKHAEVIGVNGWCDNSADVLDGNSEYTVKSGKTLVLFQTTFPVEKVESSLQKLITDGSKTLEIFNTICYTTTERQKLASEISRQCDTVLVIGGKSSSNTRRLFEICENNCGNTLLISEPDELKHFDFSKTRCLGVIAGASTPDELIEEVLSVIDKQTKDVTAESIQKSESELFFHAVDKLPEKRKSLKSGQKLKGTVQHIDEHGVTVSFDFSKKEGYIPNDELTLSGDAAAAKAAMQIGDKIEVMVVSADKELIVSKKQIEELYKDDALVEGIKAGNEFTLTAQKEVKGGLLSKLGSYTVFIPSSQIRSGFVRDLGKYVGKELRLVALPDGVDDHKRKIVASQRLLLESEQKEWEDNFWGNIEVGEIVEGKVMRFAPFGAFVSVRGFDCLAHLSDLSWSPVKEPGEVLKLNQTYEFVVLKTDREANRISIGYKQLQADPWQTAYDKHPVGSVTQGKVVRILPFGAFVEIEPSVDGLLHVSNVTWDWVEDIKKVLKIGDVIDVQILEFIPEQRRITLSRKATMEQPAEVINKVQKRRHDDEMN